jgi:hypothetical protein
MRVARERETSDDRVELVVDRNEDSRVSVATYSLEVAALVGGCSPGLGREEPFAGLAADRGREANQLVRVLRLRASERDHGTTTPCPPRRGSPAAPRTVAERRSTADAPPKKRLRSSQRTTS